jgi:hypothetical protein
MNCLKNIESTETNRLEIDGEIIVETHADYSPFGGTQKKRLVTYQVVFNTQASHLDAYEEVRLKLISEAEKIEKYIKEQKEKV